MKGELEDSKRADGVGAVQGGRVSSLSRCWFQLPRLQISGERPLLTKRG